MHFEKFQTQPDGSLLVSGIASTESLDSDGEVITAEAMRDALPDYLRWSNLREMHSKSAVGRVLDCQVGQDGRTRIRALIVDREAIRKIIARVYNGFSIAGQVLRKIGNRIVQLALTEISLVDRPANPECVLSFGKRQSNGESTHTAFEHAAQALSLRMASRSSLNETEQETLLRVAKMQGKAIPFDDVTALSLAPNLLAKVLSGLPGRKTHRIEMAC